jgi:hypothetical protein
VLGVAALAVAIIVWAVWGAPRSARRLQGIAYWLLRVVFDAAGAIALYMSGQQLLGTIFALVAALNCILGYAWKQNETDLRKDNARCSKLENEPVLSTFIVSPPV